MYELVLTNDINLILMSSNSSPTNPVATCRHNDAVIDSGTTSHTWPAGAPIFHPQPTPLSTATTVALPNGATMLQTHTGDIPLLNIPAPA